MVSALLLLLICILWRSPSSAESSVLDLLEEDVLQFKEEYLQYLATFAKATERSQDLRRLIKYVQTKRLIERHNSKGLAYRLGMNEFADLLDHEVRALFGNNSFAPPPHMATTEPLQGNALAADLSVHLDWSSESNPIGQAVLTKVNSQGTCGACWAFATASAVEASVKLSALAHMAASAEGAKMPKAQAQERVLSGLPSLSAQELIDCDHDFNNGCDGGNIFHALDYVVDHGLVRASAYGYEGKVNHCHHLQNTTRYFIRQVQPIATLSPWALQAALQHGPVAVGICGTGESFLFYSGGIYDDQSCCVTLNHAMLVVGYGYDERLRMPYWIALNSWGWYWGEGGYVKLLRTDAGAGICGLYLSPVQANAGYLLLANGQLAYSDGSPSDAMDAYKMRFERLMHTLEMHWRQMVWIAAGVMIGLSCLCLCCACLESCFGGRSSRGRRHDRSQYQVIPDDRQFV